MYFGETDLEAPIFNQLVKEWPGIRFRTSITIFTEAISTVGDIFRNSSNISQN